MLRWLLLFSALLLSQWLTPWFTLFFIGGLYGWFKAKKSPTLTNSLAAAMAGLIVWTGMAWVKDYNTGYAITERLQEALQLNGVVIYLVTGSIAFIAMGLATYTGSQLRRSFS